MPMREDAMGALDAALAEEDMAAPPDAGLDDVPMAVVCQVCGTEVDTVTGEPIMDPELAGGQAPMPPGGLPEGGAVAPPAM